MNYMYHLNMTDMDTNISPNIHNLVIISLFSSFVDLLVRYPKFMGTGYVAFPVLRGAYKEFSITIEFRPDTQNGLLLFSSEHPNARADFFSVSLVDGYAQFR